MNILSKDIIKEWGLSELPKAKQDQMVEQIGHVLYQAVLVKSLDILGEKEQDELDQILDKDETAPEDVLRFLQKKIPTFEKMLSDERKNIKDDILAFVS